MRKDTMEVRQRPIPALGLRLLAMFFMSLLLLQVKMAGQRGIALGEVMFWRQLLPALFIGGWLAARGQLWRLSTRRLGTHARRASLGVVGMVLTFGAVLLLPLAEATVLGFASPIFAVILAATLLREHVGPVRWLAVALGFAGVVIVAGPDRSHMSAEGVAVGIGAAFMVALISIQIRDLGRTEEAVSVVFWFSALSAAALALALPFTAVAHDAGDWLVLLGIGVSGTLAQLLLTAALRLGPVSSVITMDYSQFGWATLWGWLVFGNMPPHSTMIGAPAIIAAGLIIVWREHRLVRNGRRGAEPGEAPERYLPETDALRPAIQSGMTGKDQNA